jgi:hypothetical protein
MPPPLTHTTNVARLGGRCGGFVWLISGTHRILRGLACRQIAFVHASLKPIIDLVLDKADRIRPQANSLGELTLAFEAHDVGFAISNSISGFALPQDSHGSISSTRMSFRPI